jgi:hypothetical protein
MNQKGKKIIRLSSELEGFVKDSSNEQFSRASQLQRAWEELASPRILEHTDSVVFSTKTKQPRVLIYVDGSHWAAELESEKELYRILLERETGWEIHELKFLVTRKAMFKKLFKKREGQKHGGQNKEKQKKTAVPLSKTEDRYARELVSSVQDEELQKRLYKAMKADFEWKKGNEGLNLPQKPPHGPETT